MKKPLVGLPGECLAHSRCSKKLSISKCQGQALRWALVLPTSAHVPCNPSHEVGGHADLLLTKRIQQGVGCHFHDWATHECDRHLATAPAPCWLSQNKLPWLVGLQSKQPAKH